SATLSLVLQVWLSILSVLPHSDLCRVVQVCSRLHTLATDHTLCESVHLHYTPPWTNIM
uniref:F-box domain-containing protein n=1 Tax=Mastacembelus armatus TaxID=205130 RepID=A0A3Q3KMS5_9TELE